ncbi:hypothetical protein G5B30_01905 [Sphingobacterium sp. SGG-5]|uniref:hypothetical protein n=1 Tax=Sphingobacterium sp. SGG-5 TaxID=2710881 RepID=UPI0013ECA271|nr:hypothetical protein [Sphingobacterium sp. SGG-5]NGM60661.1 hypothetical protein [Sphingobacterium sp. SGG-5]
MSYLLYFEQRWFFAFMLTLSIVSCGKDRIPIEEKDELYTLNFKFEGFTATKQPLNAAFKHSSRKLASTSGDVETPGYLYFWAFNQGSLYPDIQIPSGRQTVITYNQGITPGNFVSSTYTYTGFEAGKALSFQGAEEIIFEMPIKGVQQITNLGFDIGSSGKGPKDFELYYSIDGENYSVLQQVNQFESATANAKNSFIYDLQEKAIFADRLWIKIIPQAGDRMGGDEFNRGMGTCRLDNFYLEGIYDRSQANQMSKLYYFIYHRENKDIYQIGEVNEEDLADFALQLPFGTYDLMFVLNQSDFDLILSSNPENWTNVFVGNYFSNGNAMVYGVVDQIEVMQDESFTFTLDRWYSQVSFAFTDTDLSLADRIVVRPLHAPFYFVPWGEMIADPMLDATELVFEEGFASEKQIIFNQFLGPLIEVGEVSYQLEVYADDRLLRTFTVGDNMKNNMQLTFTGELMEDVEARGGFLIDKNEVWEGVIEAAF